MIFSTAQTENWLWGIGLTNFLPALFLVTSLMIAIHPGAGAWSRSLGVILCCAAAMYSAGLGFACWPLAGAVLAWSTSRGELKQKAIPLFTVVGAFVLFTGLYFRHYVKPPPWPGQTLPMTAGSLIQFFLAFLGNSFAEIFGGASVGAAIGFGILLCALIGGAGAYFVCAWRRWRDFNLCTRMLPWFSLAGYAAFAAALGAVTRVRSGIEQGIASRYTSFSLYLIVALIGLTPIILRDLAQRGIFSQARRAYIGRVLAAALGLAAALVFPRGIGDARVWQDTRMREKGAMLLGSVLPDNPLLSTSIPNPDQSLPLAQQLSAMGYLRPRLISSANAGLIEDPAVAFAKGEITRIVQLEPGSLICAGWAQLTASDRGAGSVFITCDNDRGEPIIVATALTGAQWSGVVPTRADTWQGWFASIPLARLPQGVPVLRLTAWALDTRTAKACRVGTTMLGT
jgi:hypothetical protein